MIIVGTLILNIYVNVFIPITSEGEISSMPKVKSAIIVTQSHGNFLFCQCETVFLHRRDKKHKPHTQTQAARVNEWVVFVIFNEIYGKQLLCYTQAQLTMLCSRGGYLREGKIKSGKSTRAHSFRQTVLMTNILAEIHIQKYIQHVSILWEFKHVDSAKNVFGIALWLKNCIGMKIKMPNCHSFLI